MNETKVDHQQDSQPANKEALDHQRDELLQDLEDWLEMPMVVLAFIWLGLLVGNWSGASFGRLR